LLEGSVERRRERGGVVALGQACLVVERRPVYALGRALLEKLVVGGRVLDAVVTVAISISISISVAVAITIPITIAIAIAIAVAVEVGQIIASAVVVVSTTAEAERAESERQGQPPGTNVSRTHDHFTSQKP
jgi:hypothetical protein